MAALSARELVRSKLAAVVFALALAPFLVAFPPSAEAVVPEDGSRPKDDPDAWLIHDTALVGYLLVPPPQLELVAAKHGGSIERVDTTLQFAVVHVPEEAMDAFLAEARSTLGVTYAKLDGRIEAAYVPDDPRYSEQWGPPTIHMEEAWDTTTGSHDIIVAIIDTGIDYTHPDLADNVCVLGPDYPNGDNDPMDDHFHGTHVGGTVAGVIGNGVGVAGMSNACLMAVKVLGGGGGGQWSDLASAVVWAADNGANIISMSLGGCPGCDPGSPVTEAMQYASTAGVLIVSAAGNAYCDAVGFPAGYPESMAIAALAPPGDETAFFSSCGDKVEVSAPGQDVISTVPLFNDPSGYNTYSGTSMATPHVSGVAALFWSAHPELSAGDVRCILAQQADDVMGPGKDVNSGFGRINAQAMLANPACTPQPPTAALLSALSGDGTVLLGWNTPFAWGDITGYNVYRGAAPDALALHASLGVVNAYEDVDVTVGTTYYYRVSAVNGAGEGDLSNLASIAPVNALQVPFLEDVESGAPGWALDGLWHVTTDRSASATHSLYFGEENGPGTDDNEYDTGQRARGAVVSPPIDLEGLTTASVSFWQWWDAEGFGYEAPVVQLATAAAPGVYATIYDEFAPSHEGLVALDLSAYVGQVVWLRFLFDTLDAYGNFFEGWYVDDIAVSDQPAPNLPPWLTIVVPEPDGYAAGTVFFAGFQSDGNGRQDVEQVRVRADGGEWSNGTLGLYWYAYLTLATGTHTAEAQAFDGELWSDVASVTFQVDGDAPLVAIAAPLPDTEVPCAVEVTGTLDDQGGSGVNYMFGTLDGSWVTFEWFNGTNQVEPFSTVIDMSLAAPGTHTVGVVAVDNAGNYGVDVTVSVLKQDMVCLPVAVIQTPQDGENVGGTVTIAGSVVIPPDATLGGVVVLVDGGFLGSAHLVGTNWSIDWETFGLPDDSYVLSAFAYSGNGYSGPEASISVFLSSVRFEIMEFAGTTGCSVGFAVVQTRDYCGQGATIRTLVDPGLTAARFELTWDAEGVVPDDLDDLGLNVFLAFHAWKSSSEGGNTLVFEVAAPDGEFLTDRRWGATIDVVASNANDLPNVSTLEAFELTVTWAYNGAAFE